MKLQPPPHPHTMHTLSLEEMATEHGETMVWRTSIIRAHTPRTTPTTWNPSMLELRRRARRGPHMHTEVNKHKPQPRNHATPNARKVQEDGNTVKEKHPMIPHPPPHPHNMHTLSPWGMTTRSCTRYGKYVTAKKNPCTPSL